MRRYTLALWLLFNGLGWRGCRNFTRHPARRH